MTKQKYYNIKKLLSNDAEYNMLLGERSNGKSYAVKEHCVTQAFNDANRKFILLRRWQLEIKGNLIESYFADCPVKSITKGEYESITYFRGTLYLCNFDEDGKVIKGKVIGYVRGLTAEEHYKSGAYNDCENIIFEEFLSRSGYLPHEPTTLMSFVSTVARRRRIHIYMIGNTISRICPYFNEWQLTGVMRQKIGTIDIYRMKTEAENADGTQVFVKIAVEYCENSGKNTIMSFGQSAKMTSNGVWECESYPHLTKRVECYTLIHEVVVVYQAHKFYVRFLQDENGNYFAYVEPKSTELKKNTRIISDRFNPDIMHTNFFIGLNDTERYLFNLIKMKKVCFSDNLTGSEFYQVYNALKGGE